MEGSESKASTRQVPIEERKKELDEQTLTRKIAKALIMCGAAVIAGALLLYFEDVETAITPGATVFGVILAAMGFLISAKTKKSYIDVREGLVVVEERAIDAVYAGKWSYFTGNFLKVGESIYSQPPEDPFLYKVGDKVKIEKYPTSGLVHSVNGFKPKLQTAEKRKPYIVEIWKKELDVLYGIAIFCGLTMNFLGIGAMILFFDALYLLMFIGWFCLVTLVVYVQFFFLARKYKICIERKDEKFARKLVTFETVLLGFTAFTIFLPYALISGLQFSDDLPFDLCIAFYFPIILLGFLFFRIFMKRLFRKKMFDVIV